MKKILAILFVLLFAGVLFAALESEAEKRAVILCENLNMKYVSHNMDQDGISFVTYHVRCGREDSTRVYVLRYNKFFGTWSQEHLLR